MKRQHVDVAIIGGGTAGLNARRAALAHTDSVVLIEGGIWGTTCARVGCMPSKLLIAAAESAHAARRAPGFGVYPGPLRIDGEEVMARVRRERDRFVGFVLDGIEKIPAEQKIVGNARFLDNTTLDVEGMELTAGRIVIATGSRPVIAEPLLSFAESVIVNDDLFSMETLPRSVAVFGTGVIGLELAQALHRLGVDVRLFGNSGRIRPLTDPKVRDSTEEVLNREYFIAPKNPVTAIERLDQGGKIHYRDRDRRKAVFTAEYLLAATGRRPNVDTLSLENTDLELDERGVPIVVDRHTMQTSVPTIFIAGDASDQAALLHEAADQGRIAGDNAGRFPEITGGLRRSHLAVVFCDPQIAVVGESYAGLCARLGDDRFAIGEVDFSGQGRARTMLRNSGLLRVYADRKSGRFLGAEMVAPDGEHLGHLLAWAHQQELTVGEILDLPFYHPVVEEGLRTALQQVATELAGKAG